MNSGFRRKINEKAEKTTLRNINQDDVVSKTTLSYREDDYLKPETTLSNREDDYIKPKTKFIPVSRRRINDHFTKTTPTGNHNFDKIIR